MKTKVTLSLDRDFVKKAKLNAKERNKTLSDLVTESVQEIWNKADLKEMKLEAINRLAGRFDLPEEHKEKTYDELKYEALKEKYDLP